MLARKCLGLAAAGGGVVFNYLLKTAFAAVTGQPVTLASPQTLDTVEEGMVIGSLKCVQNNSTTTNKIKNDALSFNRTVDGPPGSVMVGGVAQNNKLVLKAKFKALSADSKGMLTIRNSEIVTSNPTNAVYAVGGNIYGGDYFIIGGGFTSGKTYEAIMYQYAPTVWAFFVKLPDATTYRFGGVTRGVYTSASTVYPVICSNLGEVEANLSVVNDFESTLLTAWTQFATAVRASNPFDACCNRPVVWMQARPPVGQQIEIRFKMDASGLNYWKFVLKPSGSNNALLYKVIDGVQGSALATASIEYYTNDFNFFCCPDLGITKILFGGYPYLSYPTVDNFNATETGMDIIIPTGSTIDSGAQTVIAAYEGHAALEDIEI